MDNSCICAPIHEPKFVFGRQFVKSYNDLFVDIDIFLVFSSQELADKFKNINADLRYHTLVVDSNLITVKKWYGVDTIFKTTDMKYVGVVDVDSCFIKNKNYSELFHTYYSNRIIYGHFSIHPQNIHRESQARFDKNQQNIIEKKVYKQDKVFYFWFNNIPIYERNDFAEFKRVININTATWGAFDYIVYGYYLLLIDKFKMYDFDNAHNDMNMSILECSNDSSILEVIQPMWLRKKFITTNSVILNNVFMQFHVDR